MHENKIRQIRFKGNIVTQAAVIETYLMSQAEKGELIDLVIAGSPCVDLTRHNNQNASRSSKTIRGFSGVDSHLYFYVTHFVSLIEKLHLRNAHM